MDINPFFCSITNIVRCKKKLKGGQDAIALEGILINFNVTNHSFWRKEKLV
jgi:hypothetical protein